MTWTEFRGGLEILSGYYDNQNGYHVGAEHDIFYAYPTDKPLSQPDLVKLIKLGWFQPEVPEDGDGEFKPEQYDPTEGWAAFT